MQLTFVTGNANKLAEVQAFLGSSIDLKSVDLDIPELQGTAEEIALSKCLAASKLVQGPVITEDTSLGFDGWNGLPGPYIKHFVKAMGIDALAKTYSGPATATCIFAYKEPTSEIPLLFIGNCHGTIVPARGKRSFGWDAIFETRGKTFGEQTSEEKASISHRTQALQKLLEYLRNRPDC